LPKENSMQNMKKFSLPAIHEGQITLGFMNTKASHDKRGDFGADVVRTKTNLALFQIEAAGSRTFKGKIVIHQKI